jgi:hypothetical protein
MGVHSRRCARCLVPSPVLGEGRGECNDRAVQISGMVDSVALNLLDKLVSRRVTSEIGLG